MKCKHGISRCSLCASSDALKTEQNKSAPIVKVERLSARDGIKVYTAPPHYNQGPRSAALRMDKVSDRRTPNTPKPHDWRDVIDRACFKFVKNTRATK